MARHLDADLVPMLLESVGFPRVGGADGRVAFDLRPRQGISRQYKGQGTFEKRYIIIRFVPCQEFMGNTWYMYRARPRSSRDQRRVAPRDGPDSGAGSATAITRLLVHIRMGDRKFLGILFRLQ